MIEHPKGGFSRLRKKPELLVKHGRGALQLFGGAQRLQLCYSILCCMFTHQEGQALIEAHWSEGWLVDEVEQHGVEYGQVCEDKPQHTVVLHAVEDLTRA